MTESSPAVSGSLGLTTEEAARRLGQFGPNALPDTSSHPFARALSKLWAPVPWMLEGAIVLELVLGKRLEAAVIGSLLLLNGGLGLFQEGRAQATLAALKSRLALSASVRRDSVWRSVAAVDLVPGDHVRLSVGAVVSADVRLLEGHVLLDQSMLTGESFPIEAGTGASTYAGALVRRGEAIGEVTATGVRTKYGKTADLVRTAKRASSQQKVVLQVVRNLAVFNGVVTVLMLAYGRTLHLPPEEMVSLLLTSVLASIPVALPATFTLSAAVGARALGRLGVLPTRLSAVDEAASIAVLCSDKTGTLTRNELKVASVHAMPGFDQAHVLGVAALASSSGGGDPVDAAICSASSSNVPSNLPRLTGFLPFDSATRMSEATAVDAGGVTVRAVKGAFSTVSALAQPSAGASGVSDTLEAQGNRVLAVAMGPPGSVRLMGLIALSDPPREDSAAFVEQLRLMGVRTVMVTGDAPTTAAIVARAVGLSGEVCPPGPIAGRSDLANFTVFAGVLPEGKFDLVKAFQKDGHGVGMCGDGANDAPALRQAQMGIAVSTATDVAKAAAGIVLTEAGLGGIVSSVKEGRLIFQRLLTYTLNSITKKIVQVLFLAVGLLMTGHSILPPLLMVILMMAGDLLGMTLATDRVRGSALPNTWRIGSLTVAGVVMGLSELAFCTAVLAVGKFWMSLGLDGLRTLAFVALVFGNQATTYLNRTRGRMGSTRPSTWLVGASLLDLLVGCVLAVGGIAMTALPPALVIGTLAAAGLYAYVWDFAKVPVLRRLRLE